MTTRRPEPPTGYVRLSDVAKASNLSMDTLYMHAKAQTLPTITGPHSAIFVSENAAQQFKNKYGRSAKTERGSSLKINWTPEMDAVLGKMSDDAAGLELGVSPQSARSRRVGLGIASFQGQNLDFAWSQEQIALLGTQPDSAVAAAIGASPSAVKRKRESLGLSAFFAKPKKAKARLKDYVNELGRLSDQEIADKWGVHRQTVYLQRKKLSISSNLSASSLNLGEDFLAALEVFFEQKGMPSIKLTELQMTQLAVEDFKARWKAENIS